MINDMPIQGQAVTNRFGQLFIILYQKKPHRRARSLDRVTGLCQVIVIYPRHVRETALMSNGRII